MDTDSCARWQVPGTNTRSLAAERNPTWAPSSVKHFWRRLKRPLRSRTLPRGAAGAAIAGRTHRRILYGLCYVLNCTKKAPEKTRQIPHPSCLNSPLSCLARFGRRNARTMSSMPMFFLHCIIISLVGIHNEYAAGSCHAVTLLTLVVLPSSNYQNGLTIIIHSARVAQLCSISSSYGYYY